MEFYNMKTGKIDVDNHDWYEHRCGIVDVSDSDFLLELKEEVNGLFREAVEKIYPKAYSSEFRLWLDFLEMPIDVVETDHASVLVFRNPSTYISDRFYCNLWKECDLNDKMIDTVSDVLNRESIDVVSEKERECLLWLLKKLGFNVAWKAA